jgi:hypothetical protein
VAPYILGWVDISRAQYATLPSDLQHLIDLRVADLLDDPGGPGRHEDRGSGQWTTTDQAGAGVILYTFHPDLPRVAILRLSY